jgi:hypothetical protein
MRYLEVMFLCAATVHEVDRDTPLDLARKSSHPKGVRGGPSASYGATARFRLTLQMRLCAKVFTLEGDFYE